MLFNGNFAFNQFPMLFNGNLRLEKLGGGQTDGRTDVWKFTPVSYRKSALWGRCPKRDTKEDREKNKKSHEEQEVTNKINAKEITYNRRDVEQLQTHMEEAFDEINLNRGKMREAAAPMNTMWSAFRHVASRLHPRVQGRLGGKFALPAITARAAAVAATEKENAGNEEDDEYEDIDDDVEAADDSGVHDWAEASERLHYADDPPEYVVDNSSTSGGEGRRRRKRGGKGKGKGKRSRHQ